MTISTVRPMFYGPALAEVRQIVIHSVESPMTRIMSSLAAGWWQNPSNKSSVHGGADPYDFVYMAEETQRAWHCGNGNTTSLGYEHAGRAAFTVEEWLTDDSVQMLRNSCRELEKVAARHNIPLRWLSVAQVAANEKGFCTHNDMRLARGGTTHTDPGPNFPYALFMQLLQQYRGAPVDTGTPPVTPPTGPGGAQTQTQEDDVAVFASEGGMWAVVGGVMVGLQDMASASALRGDTTTSVSPRDRQAIAAALQAQGQANAAYVGARVENGTIELQAISAKLNPIVNAANRSA